MEYIVTRYLGVHGLALLFTRAITEIKSCYKKNISGTGLWFLGHGVWFSFLSLLPGGLRLRANGSSSPFLALVLFLRRFQSVSRSSTTSVVSLRRTGRTPRSRSRSPTPLAPPHPSGSRSASSACTVCSTPLHPSHCPARIPSHSPHTAGWHFPLYRWFLQWVQV